MNSIGIIGNGFVGNAVYEIMKPFYNFTVFDVKKDRSYNTFEEVDQSDMIFVSVPTPMKQTDNSFDLSILKDSIVNLTGNKILVIKSTITPSAAKELIDCFPQHDLVFNPEFLSERTAIEDFKNQKRIVLGGDTNAVLKVALFYYKVFPNCEYIATDYKTACFIKYFCNCFFAAKISMMNEFQQICKSEGADWNIAMQGFLASGWVNPMHTIVPGTDGEYGFGGKCFPKDINAFIKYSETKGIDPIILKSVWKKNLEVRENHNWFEIDGAVSNNKGD